MDGHLALSAGVLAGQRRFDRRRIGRAHQATDELHLAPPSFVAANGAGDDDRVAQRLIERQRSEPRLRQGHKSLAQRLQRMHPLLESRLARAILCLGGDDRVIGDVVAVRFVHGFAGGRHRLVQVGLL